MSPEKKDGDLTPVPSQTEQVGQIYESQEYSHDAVFGELTEGGPNYRNVRSRSSRPCQFGQRKDKEEELTVYS